MTTTTKTAEPIAPTLEVVNCASKFNVAAITNAFGIEALYGRYQDLRVVSASHDPDVLLGVGFSAVLDAVLDYRARNDRGFDVLNVATSRSHA